jgi:hypothetical protein
MARTSTFAAVVITVVVLSSAIGVAVFYSQPAVSGTITTSTLSSASTLQSFTSTSLTDSTANTSVSTSQVAWTLSDCGIHTITSETTSTEYFANTTLTSTVYELTPNVVANNSTTYTSGNSTIFTFTSYNATTTATSTTTQTTTYTTTQTYGCVVVHLDLAISYSKNWHGNYSYGCMCSYGGPMTSVNLSGHGPKNLTASFQGNFSDGLCFEGTLQKDDNSNSNLSVSWTSDSVGAFANSTSIPFGTVSWSGCSID